MDKQFITLTVRVIVKHDQKILLLQRANGGEKSRAGWELPGGKVDESESLEQAAKRELKEETGIDVSQVIFIKSEPYVTNEGSLRMVALFEAIASTEGVAISAEHKDYKWVERSNINNINIDNNHKNYLINSDDKSNKRLNKVNTTSNHVIAYTDGGSRGNPGPSALGYVVMDSDRQIIIEGGEYLGITTNNQAEYQAVRSCLEQCKRIGAREVEFYIDSLLVVNQMNGVFRVKNRDLWPIHEKIKSLSKEFDSVTFTHVRREKNKLADAKVNEVLDNHAL